MITYIQNKINERCVLKHCNLINKRKEESKLKNNKKYSR